MGADAPMLRHRKWHGRPQHQRASDDRAHVRRDITHQLAAVLDELAPRDTATDGGRL